MKGSQKIILSAVAAMTVMAGTPAFADNGHGYGQNGNNRNHSNNTYINRNYDHRDNGYTNYNYQRNIGRTDAVKIYDNDRIILTRYVQDNYKRSYPPGWSKNHHGYPPYQQTSRKYIVGYPLPNYVTYYSVPYEVRSHMRPTPIGYQYIRVDNDVLLMNMASKQIIDAVTLFAALGSR